MIANSDLVDEPTHADVPRPPRFLRIAILVFEVGCWVTAGLLAIIAVFGMALMALWREVPVTARLIDGASLIENGGGAVDGGAIDVTLQDVPLAVSWPYLLVLAASVLAWIVLCIALARIARGLRWGVPFRTVTPRFLYVLAAVWTGLAIAAPFVISATQPAMAEAAGVTVPGATFAYTMAVEDVVSIIVGPIIAVVVAVLATCSRMWSEHRTLV